MRLEHELHQQATGYWTIKNKPTVDELKSYYADKYYQQETTQYSKNYSDEELIFFKEEALEYLHVLKRHLGLPRGSMLDVGCGEGWILKSFNDAGWEVKGIDFSVDAIETFNKSMSRYFLQGDFNSLLPAISEKFNFIILKNVLEHVIDPEETISILRSKLDPNGIILIQVPNDFSKLHQHLVEKNMIDRKFWVAPPDHLSYFTHASLNCFMEKNGFELAFSSSDYPIDFDLLVPGRNYISNNDRSIGRQAHLQRIRVENFLRAQSVEGLANYHHALAEMGVGRNIVNYYKIKN